MASLTNTTGRRLCADLVLQLVLLPKSLLEREKLKLCPTHKPNKRLNSASHAVLMATLTVAKEWLVAAPNAIHL
jgi:hypothetical protein